MMHDIDSLVMLLRVALSIIGGLWLVTISMAGFFAKNIVDQLKGINESINRQGTDVAIIKFRVDNQEQEITEVKEHVVAIHVKVEKHLEESGR
jgi:hypothetical protein